METQLGELENRLADANDAAMRGGKSAMAKLETRIRELEIELGNVQAKTGENMKAHQRADRKIKVLQFQNDEDRKNQDRMSDLASKLLARSRPTRSRSRRPRRSPPSTWPSSARLSRSWRRPRTVPRWPRLLSTPPSKSHHSENIKIWIRTSPLDNQCSTLYLLPMLYKPTSFFKLTCLCLRM